MFKKINLKSEFVKNIAVLMSGTVMAQFLGYIFSPIITRIYSPEEGAELGLFIRIVAIIAAFATMRYELALPIIKNDSHSFRLYRLALRMALIVVGIAALAVLIPFGMSIKIDAKIFYLLIPIGVLFTAINNLGTYWAIKNKIFETISYTRVTNSLVASLSKIGLGWLGFGSAGLIIGMVAGAVVSTFWFVRNFFRAKKEHNVSSNSPRNYLLAKEYKEFPKVNLPHVLMDLSRDLLVAILLLQIFSKEDFGLYDLSFRMLRMPLILVGVALGQVFFQKCAEKINNNEDVLPIMKQAVKTLVLLSIVPFTILFFFAEDIFAFVFGESWRGAGVYAEIMTPWFMLNFISSPITSLPVILRRQASFFKLAIFGSSLMILSIVIPYYFFKSNVQTTLWVLSLTMSVYLVFLIFKVFSYAKSANNKLAKNEID